MMLTGKEDFGVVTPILTTLKDYGCLFSGYIREEFDKFNVKQEIPNDVLIMMTSYYPIKIIHWNKDLINTQTSEIYVTIHDNQSFINISGRINFKQTNNANYEQIGQIHLEDFYPNAETVKLQALAGTWGDARLLLNKHGLISIKPRRHIWLNASIFCSNEYQRKKEKQKIQSISKTFFNKIIWTKNQIDFKKTNLKIEKRNKMVYMTGNLDFINQQPRSGYITIAQLCKNYIPLSHTLELVALKGVGGVARFEWYKDGRVCLKPKRNVWVNIAFPTN